MTSEQIVLVGLGDLGGAIADRLIARGERIVLRDSRPNAVAQFYGRAKPDPGEPTAGWDVALLCLPDGIAVASVLPTLRGARLVVDFSTVGFQAAGDASAAVQAWGGLYLDCPVSGGADAARNGTLTLMAAGSDAALDAATSLLANLGQVRRLGDTPGQGQAVKVANNVLSATIFLATIEALCVAAKAGVSPDRALQAIDQSTGRSDSTAVKVPNDVLTGRFAAAFAAAHMEKDVSLFAQLARQLDVPTAVCDAGLAALQAAVSALPPGARFTEVAKPIERAAGVMLRSATT